MQNLKTIQYSSSRRKVTTGERRWEEKRREEKRREERRQEEKRGKEKRMEC